LHHKNGFGVATRCGLINYYTCNDPHLRFDHKNFLWCPYHKDTPRQFECTRLITVDDVKAALQRLPGFGTHAQEQGPQGRRGKAAG